MNRGFDRGISVSRPNSIGRFVALYSLCIVLEAVLGLRGTLVDLKASDPEALRYVSVLGLGVMIGVLLVYFIASRRSNVARWLVVLAWVMAGVGIVGALPRMIGTSSPPPFASVKPDALKLILFAFRTYAVWLLFRADSSRWFKSTSLPEDVSRVFE
jgi:hypothetical protein